MSILIKNGTIVNEGRQFIADILVRDKRIVKIDKDINADVERIIDATGKHVIPGMIDDQVHFREPGLTQKADMNTESRAAVAGGVTSIMDMPNTNPQAVTIDILEEKYVLASTKCVANYSFYMGATNENIEEIKKVDPKKICALKVFMGSSTGNMLVDNPSTLEAIFKYSPVMVVTHCEDTPMIEENERIFHEKYGDNIAPKYHADIRSDEACYKSSKMATDLAKKHDARLHVLHLTTEKEMKLFTSGDLNNKRISGEVCVHHLYFNADAYDTLGHQIKCNPAVKYEKDRQALLAALKNDQLDVIATDHAPHSWEDKQRPLWGAPSGVPLVQHALYALFDLYQQGELDLDLIVRKTSHAVADLFQIKDRGYIREGYFADLAIVDFNASYTVTKENIYYKCGWSPFEGKTFNSKIDTTLVSGEIVFENDTHVYKSHGMRLEFER